MINQVSDNKLLTAIKITPVVLISAFIVIINLLIIYDNQIGATRELQALRESIIERQRTFAKNQVEQLITQIENEQLASRQRLNENIKNRVNEAHAIATYIYQENQDKSKEQVCKLIQDALRNIRFNNGRGYFFIYDMDGTNIMHPVLTEIEGSSMWNFSDIDNKYVIRELSNIAETKGEGYLNWRFVKTPDDYNTYEKIGYVRRFSPYNWFIGSGDYIDDAEQDLKAQMLAKTATLKYGENGFFLILDEAGEMLYHPEQSYIGRQVFDLVDSSNKLFIQEMLMKGKHGDFVEYLAPESPFTEAERAKVSYVKNVKNWNWTIATGWYSKDLDKIIAKRQDDLSNKNDAKLAKIIALSLTFTILFLYLSLLLSQVLTKRFKQFQHKISVDFDELEQTKDTLQFMAMHDDLTHLPNRAKLRDEINANIKQASLTGSKLAVMFVDLDDFKKINDLHGHSMGDQLLVSISNKFRTLVGPDDIVARFGGDEFIFCFTNLKSQDCARQRLEAIKQVFNSDFHLEDKVVHSSCSIGVTMYPEDAQTAEDLISKADIVLYKSKEHQKGDVLFYSDDINQRVLYDFTLEEQLRQAIAKDELSIQYQPQICGRNEQIFGVEALCRWHNDKLGFVSPIDFIAVAEKIDLINDIGMFVINQACQDFKKLQQAYDETLFLSINISPKQLQQAGFATLAKEAIESHGIDTQQVTLEITENILIDDLMSVTPILEQLGEFGFDISLDDFGTGYSSLSYLSNLPISEIKIDRSFIDKFLTSRESESLVKAIIAIGNSCNLRIVAEGVETEAQKNQLQKYSCDVIQGYYFDKPLSMDVLIEKYRCDENGSTFNYLSSRQSQLAKYASKKYGHS